MDEPEVISLADLARTPAERAASAVPFAGGAVWTAAEIMHWAAWPGMTPEAALGAVAAFGIAFGLTGHKGWSRKVPLFTAAFAAWLVFACARGPLDGFPVPPLTIVLAVLTLAAWRLALRHPSVLEAIAWRAARAEWLAVRHRWHLGGSHLLEHEETRLGERMVIDVTTAGRLASQIARSDLPERIAMDRGIPKNRVTVTEGTPAGRVVIEIRERDPWAHPLTHPVLDPGHEVQLDVPCSIRVPPQVGQDPATGTILDVPVWDEVGGKNVTLVGIKGAGKGVLLNCISERVTAADDALMIRVNISVKGPAEAAMWGPACHLTAFGPQQKERALRVLRVVNGIIEWRSGQPRDTSVFIPSSDDPLVVLVMDEIDAAMAYPAIRRELGSISSKGRELGVSVVRAGQRGTAEWTGGANVRSQDDVFCLGMVNRSTEAMHAAGDLGLRLPDMATYGEGKPGVWVIACLGDPAWKAGRTWKLSEPPDVAALAAARAASQPDLPAACREFLGDEYQVLLGTDVYARWAQRSPSVTSVTASPPPDGDAQEAGTTAPVAVLDAEDPTERLDFRMDHETAARFAALDKKIKDAKAFMAETAAMPKPPDVPEDKLKASSEERWRQVGEQAEMSPEQREALLGLLEDGTTTSNAAKALGVSTWIARTYLQKLRNEGVARVDGKGRGSRWCLTEDGDGQ
jgi:hypothetical protein